MKKSIYINYDDINYVPVLSNTCRFVWGLKYYKKKKSLVYSYIFSLSFINYR